MSVFQTAYFPCISYMRAFVNDASPVIEVNDSYAKQTYRNRCKVLTANGVQTLSVPIANCHGKQLTRDAVISYDEPWQQIHSRCLESAYKSSPYFDHYCSSLSPIFKTKHKYLIDLNDSIMEALLKMLKKDIKIIHTETFEKAAENDFRDAFNAKKPVEASGAVPYYQVFGYKYDFVPDLSVIDLLFNEGPESASLLR